MGEGISERSSGLVPRLSVVLWATILTGLFIASRFNYLLFHNLAEIFSIVVASSIFVITWNARRFIDNHYLLLLGIAFLSSAALDVVHLLAYKGMPIFPAYGPNLPTQLWTASRYMLAVSLLLAPLFVTRKIAPRTTLAVYSVSTAALFVSIFYGVFPDCYVEPAGLTPFKKTSEYVISAMLVLAGYLLYLKRASFRPDVFRLLLASIGLSVASDLSFTMYADVYGIWNFTGHFLKVLAYYFVYRAITITGLSEPVDLLFRNLQQSEKKYHSLFSNMLDGFALHRTVLDESGTPVDYEFMEVNDAFEKQTGLKRKDVVGRRVTEVIPGIENDPADWIGLYGRMSLEGGELRFEQYSQDLGRWYSIMAYCTEKGHFATLIKDVTERRRAEEAIEASETRFRELFDNMSSGVAVYRPTDDECSDFVFVDFNRGAEMIDGIKREELVGRRLLEVFPGTVEFGILDVLGRVYKTGRPEHHPVTMYKDQRISGWRENYVYRLPTGEVVAVYDDVTERKQAEEHLMHELKLRKALADLSGLTLDPNFSIPEVADIVLEYAKSLTGSEHGFVTTIDPETKANVSHTLTSMMGDQCRIDSRQQTVSFPMGEDGLYPGLWGHVLNTRKPLLTNEPSTHPASRGIPEGHIPIRNFLSVPALLGDVLAGQIAVSNSVRQYTDRDVTVLERLAEIYALAIQRMRHEEALRKSIREKEMLIREIHHRVKNNLLVVASLLRLQSSQARDKETVELFKTSQNRVRSMLMIHERLYRSKDFTRIDFGDYIHSLAVQLFHAYEVNASRVKLTFDLSDAYLDVDTVIPCGLLVNELVTNALKHAFPEGGEGEIFIGFRDNGDRKYTLTVKDNGAGLPGGLDLFKTRSLGMQLVTSLAKQLRGSLEVHRDGRTEFIVTFRELGHEDAEDALETAEDMAQND